MRTVPVFNQGRHIPIRTGKGAAAFSDKRPLSVILGNFSVSLFKPREIEYNQKI